MTARPLLQRFIATLRACRVTKFHIKVLKNIIPDPKTKLFASLHPYNCRASQEPKQLCL